MGLRYQITVSVGLFAVAGCVAPSGKGVLRSDDALPRNAAMVMAPPSEAPSNMLRDVSQATQTALTRLGYQFRPSAEFLVETAYSERPLTVSFETDGGLNAGSAKRAELAFCAQRIQRLTLVIVHRPTGRPVYQGEAEVTRCASDSNENATRLANAALARLQSTLATR